MIFEVLLHTTAMFNLGPIRRSAAVDRVLPGAVLTLVTRVFTRPPCG